MPAPAAAASAGYFTKTYSSTTYSSGNVDMGLSYADGFQWYFGNFLSYTPPNNAGVTLNMDGTMSVASHPDSGILLATAGQVPGTTDYVGSVFTGGAYFEAELYYDPATISTGSGWPKLGVSVIEHLMSSSGQQWTGQTTGYLHYFEAEIMDAFLTSTSQYRGLLHDRYGIIGGSSVDRAQTFSLSSPNFNTTHTYGMLWVPATSGSQGYFKFYFDNVQVGSTVTYSQFTNQTPPPTTGTFWTFGIADYQSLVLTLASGLGSPLTVGAVNVWQNTGVPFDVVEVPKIDATVGAALPSTNIVVSKEAGVAVLLPSYVAVVKESGLAVVEPNNVATSKESGVVVVEPNNVATSKVGGVAIIKPPDQQEIFKFNGMVVVVAAKPVPIAVIPLVPPDSLEPVADTTVDFSIKVLEAGFGNDYILTVPDGLNATSGVYTVVFDGLSLTQLQSLEHFFAEREGFIPFTYTIPGESTAKVFKCKTWTRALVGPSWKLTCEFRQTFDLS